MGRRTSSLTILLLAAALAAAVAWAQPAGKGRVGETGAVPPVAVDSELPDGDETLAIAQERLAAAGNETEVLQALVTIVNLHRRRGDYSEGLAQARDGLARARRLGDARLQIEFMYLLGRLYWNLTAYPQSIEQHLEELRLGQEVGDPSLLARTHGGLGLTYQRFGRNADALHHFALGLDFAAKGNDERMRASILNSLGNYHLGEGDFVRATAEYTEALRIRESTGNRRAIAETLTNLGLAADGQGDRATALNYLERSLATFEALKYRRYIANTHRRLSRVLRHAGRTEEALAHLRTALDVASTLESAEVLADIYQEFALTHEERGEFALALDYQRRRAAAHETMRGEQDRLRMSELQARYGAEQRELEIALLRRDQELQTAEIRRRRFQSIALAAGLGLGLVLLGAVIMVQRVRLRVERRLLVATSDARERAEKAERLKSRLLQIASHDLKVPLTALTTTAGQISGAPHDPVAVKRLADGIRADTARMRSLVRDFLDAAAIEDGNLQLHTANLDLPVLVDAAVDGLRVVAEKNNQRITVQPLPSPLPPVSADADRLRQVFDNLIGNALKYSPKGGLIEISFGAAEAWVFAEVRDSGPGLGPADFAKIFAPFQRLSAKPADEEEDSTGLGLFIARELLTFQGGRLEVQSQPGRGAVFRVLLPAAVPEPAA